MDKKVLYRYFSHQATPEERTQVRRWVDESPENFQEFLSERAMFDAATVLIDETEAYAGTSRLRRIVRSVSRVAAVAVVTLVLSYFVRTIYFQPEVPMLELEVPAGQQLNLTLADGTNVWLNSKTRLRYPAYFSGDERRVEIDGEGYFDVEHNAGMPFLVETSKGKVEVLGTTFNVEAYSSDSTFCTSLLKGAVRICSGNRSYRLIPGQTISLMPDGTMKTEAIDDYDEFRWTEGIISLKNDSFRNIMKKFEKYYGVTISVEKAGLDGVAYSGRFYQIDGINYALKVLQRDIDFKFETDRENHIIHIK